jgi:nitronate monooxygenase
MTAMPATRFTELLGIRYPIVQAPIGSATTPELAAAVSNAGALGTLSVTWRSLDELDQVIKRTVRRTKHAFGVNVVLAWPQERRIALALERGVRLVWTFWGDPRPHVAAVHAAGALLFHTVGSVDEAESAAAAGVDLLIAQGLEAGGHVRGATPWRELLAKIIEKVPGIPIVVAGGIATGADIAAVLSAGADGACLGTRFVCSYEADAAQVYQQQIVHASSEDTLLTDLFDKGWLGAPHRVLRNSTVRMWDAAGRPAPGERPGEHDCVAMEANGTPVERYSDVIPTSRVTGDLEALALYAGESCARIHDVRPAAAIVRRLAQELAEAGYAA